MHTITVLVFIVCVLGLVATFAFLAWDIRQALVDLDIAKRIRWPEPTRAEALTVRVEPQEAEMDWDDSHPVRRALARAPMGPPLTREEREALEAAKDGAK